MIGCPLKYFWMFLADELYDIITLYRILRGCQDRVTLLCKFSTRMSVSSEYIDKVKLTSNFSGKFLERKFIKIMSEIFQENKSNECIIRKSLLLELFYLANHNVM